MARGHPAKFFRNVVARDGVEPPTPAFSGLNNLLQVAAKLLEKAVRDTRIMGVNRGFNFSPSALTLKLDDDLLQRLEQIDVGLVTTNIFRWWHLVGVVYLIRSDTATNQCEQGFPSWVLAFIQQSQTV